MRFRATLQPVSHGGQYVLVPPQVAAREGLKHAARVRGAVRGVAYRSSMMKYADGFHVLVPKATLAEAGIAAGATITLTIEADPEPLPSDTVPPELARALRASAAARAGWEVQSPAHRREHVKYIVEAKKPETRVRRVARTIETLAQHAPRSRR